MKNKDLFSTYQLLFIIELFLLISYLYIITLGYKEFGIWPQVGNYLFPSTPDNRWNIIIQLFIDKHPHAFRILLIYPLFELSDIIGIDTTLLFSLTLVILLYITYKLLASIVRCTTSYQYPILILFIFFGISLFMNGRIIFAFLGNTLILYLLYQKKYSSMSTLKFIFFFLLALLLSSVSSGTLMVAIGSTILFYLLNTLYTYPYIKKQDLYLYTAIIVFLFLLMPIILQLIQKNLDFFSGSFIMMLDHGIGRYLKSHGLFLLPFIIVIPFIFLLLHNLIVKNIKNILALSMIFASLFIGLFGISSLISGVPAFILFFYLNMSYINSENTEVNCVKTDII